MQDHIVCQCTACRGPCHARPQRPSVYLAVPQVRSGWGAPVGGRAPWASPGAESPGWRRKEASESHEGQVHVCNGDRLGAKHKLASYADTHTDHTASGAWQTQNRMMLRLQLVRKFIKEALISGINYWNQIEALISETNH